MGKNVMIALLPLGELQLWANCSERRNIIIATSLFLDDWSSMLFPLSQACFPFIAHTNICTIYLLMTFGCHLEDENPFKVSLRLSQNYSISKWFQYRAISNPKQIQVTIITVKVFKLSTYKEKLQSYCSIKKHET